MQDVLVMRANTTLQSSGQPHTAADSTPRLISRQSHWQDTNNVLRLLGNFFVLVFRTRKNQEPVTQNMTATLTTILGVLFILVLNIGQ